MRVLLSTTALVCLLSVPALAQTATGTGVGVANSNSNSKSGAVAISGQGGRGGNSSLTINNPANTTSTVNSNISGTTTQNVNSRVSGTTTSNVNQRLSGTTTSNINQSGSTRVENVASGTQTIKNVPSIVAPGLAAAGLETCLGSVSGGGAFVGTGFSFGTTIPDPGCAARLDARTLWSMGLKKAAVARLCLNGDIVRSMPDMCAEYLPQAAPVGYPAGYVAPVAYSENGYGDGVIMVVEGKTGRTRPCRSYDGAGQRCRAWADASPKIKIAAGHTPLPRKQRATVAATPNSPVPAVAPAPSSAPAEEPK